MPPRKEWIFVAALVAALTLGVFLAVEGGRFWAMVRGMGYAEAGPSSPAIAVARLPHPRSDASRRALLVGVHRYPDAAEAPPVSGAVADVEGLKEILCQRFGFPEEEVLVLQDREATGKRIREAFEDHLIAPANERTVAVFFFAGHGSQVADGPDGDELDAYDECLVPYDGFADGGARRISDDELHDLFTRLGQKTPWACGIFDCCHSGTLHRGENASNNTAGATRSVPPLADSEVIRELLRNRRERRSARPEASVEMSKAVDSVAFFFACRPYQVALGLLPGRWPVDRPRGLFSLCFQQALAELPVSATWQQLFWRTRMAMLGYTPDQQPEFRGPWTGTALGGRPEESAAVARVVAATPEGLLAVDAGELHGLRVGTVLEVRPLVPGTAPDHAIVVQTGPTTSTARLRERSGGPAVDPAEHAGRSVSIVEQPAPAPPVLSLYVPPAGELRQAEDRGRLESLIEQSPFVRTGSQHERKELQALTLRWSAARGYEAVTAEEIAVLPPAFRDRLTEPHEVVAALHSYAVWNSLRSVHNRPPALEEQVEVSIDFGRLEADGRFAASARPVQRDAGGVRLLVHPEQSDAEELVRVRVDYRGEGTIFAWVLDLMPDWSVTPIPPRLFAVRDDTQREDYWDEAAAATGIPVRRGQPFEGLCRLNTKGWATASAGPLDPSAVDMTETLKVIVTLEPCDLRPLASEGVAAPSEEFHDPALSVSRGGLTGNRIEQLLAARRSGLRGATVGGTIRPWLTATEEFSFRR